MFLISNKKYQVFQKEKYLQLRDVNLAWGSAQKQHSWMTDCWCFCPVERGRNPVFARDVWFLDVFWYEIMFFCFFWTPILDWPHPHQEIWADDGKFTNTAGGDFAGKTWKYKRQGNTTEINETNNIGDNSKK